MKARHKRFGIVVVGLTALGLAIVTDVCAAVDAPLQIIGQAEVDAMNAQLEAWFEPPVDAGFSRMHGRGRPLLSGGRRRQPADAPGPDPHLFQARG